MEQYSIRRMERRISDRIRTGRRSTSQAGEAADEEMLAKIPEEYSEKFNDSMVGLYGFNNTYTLAVRKES